MNNLQGKVVLITGGGSGIGLAVARLFLQEGCRVAISGRDAKKLEKAAGELQGGKNLTTYAVDVAQVDKVRDMVQQVHRNFGPIDILVNNAGTNLKDRTFRQLTPENWDRLIRTNLDGAFYCIHEVLPRMVEKKDGIIVNISSIAGIRASALGGTAYSASKFGMTALGLCVGAEEKDQGIRVTNIYPGEVDTPILEVRPQPVTEEHRSRILKPEDVAQAVLFVCKLPARVSVPELVIKPTSQMFV